LLSLGPALDARVANPFFGLITGGSLATATIPAHRLLRPYPEFSGRSNYNALLVKLSQQFSSGLMLMSSYQWSKAIDNIGETESSPGGAADGFRDNQNFRIERSLAAHDLPIGKGKKLGGNMNRVANFAWWLAAFGITRPAHRRHVSPRTRRKFLP